MCERKLIAKVSVTNNLHQRKIVQALGFFQPISTLLETEASVVMCELKRELIYKSVSLDTFYCIVMIEVPNQSFCNWVNAVWCYNWVIGSSLLI